MPLDEDKYPVESDRRRFVKGVVGGAALAGVTTASAAAVNTATAPTGAGGGTTEFYAVENTDGPAPRGMPQIPVEIDSEGYLKGGWPEYEEGDENAVTEGYGGSDVTYSSAWFQYCGVQTYSGVYPDADQDNYFRYSSSGYDWHADKGGDKIHIDDFAELGETWQEWNTSFGTRANGKPASGTWRSQDLPPAETMPIQIIRSQNVLDLAEEDPWIDASTEQGCIAWLNKCTHFCCVPGFKNNEGSAKFGAADQIYCQCHQSVYDPYSIVKKAFVALPRPEKEG
jgi:Rieske Fe-S protein